MPLDPQPLDFAGAQRPGPQALVGEHVRLEPLRSADHGAALWVAATGPDTDPALWDYLPYGPFADQEAFAAYLASWEKTPDPFAYAVIPAATRQAAGVATFLRIDPANGSTEIGHIWLGAGLQRSRAATEAFALLTREAFETLGNRRLEWKCNAANDRSRRAAERLGFVYEGIFRQHMIVKGSNRDTAWFSIIDRDWPQVRDGFEQWLAPANFDEQGYQRGRLEDLRSRATTMKESDAVPNEVIAKHPFQVASESDQAEFTHLLAPDVTLHSPVMNEPFRGRDFVGALLPRLRGLFERMTYTDDLVGPGSRALRSAVTIAGAEGENMQILQFDAEGLITDITILVRPMPVAMAVVTSLGLDIEPQDDGTYAVAFPGS